MSKVMLLDFCVYFSNDLLLLVEVLTVDVGIYSWIVRILIGTFLVLFPIFIITILLLRESGVPKLDDGRY